MVKEHFRTRSLTSFLCLSIWVTSANALSLPFQATSRPRHTKYSSPTPPPLPVVAGAAAPIGAGRPTPAAPPAPVTPGSGVGVYQVVNDNDITCILLKTDALIEIDFKSNIGDEEGDTYMPEETIVEGNCKNEDDSSMRITWKGYILVIYFAKTPGGERWYISNLELTVSTDLPHYHNIKTQGRSFKLYHNKMVIPTPVGKSYSCAELRIDLTPKEGDTKAPRDLRGVLYLRALQLQPFMYKGREFGPAYECSAARGVRSETAPIAVGSTLAIAVLLTVGGYGAFRYFKTRGHQLLF